MRSARAHSQQCTTAAVIQWTLESKVWFSSLSMANFGDVQSWLHIEWYVKRLTWNDDFDGSYYRLHFGVRSTSDDSNKKTPMLLLKIALKWWALWLTSEWWKVCGWVARCWCIVKLTRKKWSQITWLYRVLETCLLRLTPIFKLNAVRTYLQWEEVCCALLRNGCLIHGLWRVAWMGSGEAWLMSFSTSTKENVIAFISLGEEVRWHFGFHFECIYYCTCSYVLSDAK